MDNLLYEELYASMKEGWQEAGYWKGKYQASRAFGVIGFGILGYELYKGFTKWKEEKDDKNFDE